MPTWNAQLEAGFVFVGVDPIPTDPLRSIDSRFAPSMPSTGGMSVDDKKEFIAALKNLYEHSATAASIIGAAVGWNGAAATKSFYFIKNANQAFSWLNSNGVVLDLAFARSIRFMGLRGTL